MKTWDRGRKKATLEQKEAARQWQNQRVKIANLLARNPEIEKKCIICGNEGKILHNRKDPYYITFICDECKKEPNNLIVAEESRFDVRDKIDKNHLCVQHFSDAQVIRIIVEYMQDETRLSIGDYCNKVGISRHQFNQVIQKYKILCPRQKNSIERMINNKSKTMQKYKLKKIAEEKELT